MLPFAAANICVVGLNNSAVAVAGPVLVTNPPTSSTVPSFNKVAV
jgi:hypothetical protein